MKLLKWLLTIVVLGLSVSLYIKGQELRGTQVDGDGIGVQLLGIELVDRLPESKIPLYANGLWVVAFILFLVSIGFIYFNVKKSNS
ncbi:hypothetical protein ACTWQB_01400 [Piscibacillus sp. B03]|uniref:hypothetical protein n=1 Tax=Piscibacillus sp. B03 TaxID=3457430 RepID=UPI003FCD03D4